LASRNAKTTLWLSNKKQETSLFAAWLPLLALLNGFLLLELIIWSSRELGRCSTQQWKGANPLDKENKLLLPNRVYRKILVSFPT